MLKKGVLIFFTLCALILLGVWYRASNTYAGIKVGDPIYQVIDDLGEPDLKFQIGP